MTAAVTTTTATIATAAAVTAAAAANLAKATVHQEVVDSSVEILQLETRVMPDVEAAERDSGAVVVEAASLSRLEPTDAALEIREPTEFMRIDAGVADAT